MVWAALAHLVALIVDLLLTTARRTDDEKELQILMLQHQLRLLQRERPQPPRPMRWEKLTFAVLTARLAQRTAGPRRCLDATILLFKPDTVLRWHRELVRRKWTVAQRRTAGRPPIADEVEALIQRLARENPSWGYSRIHGELLKLRVTVGRSTVRDVLKRHQVLPAPDRCRQGSTWRAFLARHRDQILACDCFTVDTLFLQTVHVLFFIHVGTRRVFLAGCTTKPDHAWVTQQARHFSWHLQDGAVAVRYLIRDRDAKYPASFDTVFRSDGVTIIRTPVRAPNANAVAERWIRSVRQECLDHLLIVDPTHLHQIVTTYLAFYNQARPHQGLDQQPPASDRPRRAAGSVRRRALLGGLLNDYERVAA